MLAVAIEAGQEGPPASSEQFFAIVESIAERPTNVEVSAGANGEVGDLADASADAAPAIPSIIVKANQVRRGIDSGTRADGSDAEVDHRCGRSTRDVDISFGVGCDGGSRVAAGTG